jgi:hypothetical protein
MTTITAADAPAQDLRVPPAVAEWLAEQGLPPIRPRGAHRLEQARVRIPLPANWPFEPVTALPELGTDALYHDEHGVIRPKLSKESAFRGHAARHTARSLR